MTAKELEIAIKEHEMQRLELKESFGAETIESACAFANAHGGFIVIGIDNNGHLAKKPLRGESLRDYENRIATSTEPSVAADAEKVEFAGAEADYSIDSTAFSDCPLMVKYFVKDNEGDG